MMFDIWRAYKTLPFCPIEHLVNVLLKSIAEFLLVLRKSVEDVRAPEVLAVTSKSENITICSG